MLTTQSHMSILKKDNITGKIKAYPPMCGLDVTAKIHTMLGLDKQNL